MNIYTCARTKHQEHPAQLGGLARCGQVSLAKEILDLNGTDLVK